MLHVALTRVTRLRDLLVVPFSKEVVNELHTKPVFKQRMYEYRRLHRLERDTVKRWDLKIGRDTEQDDVALDSVIGDSEILSEEDEDRSSVASSNSVEPLVDRFNTKEVELIMILNQSGQHERAEIVTEALRVRAAQWYLHEIEEERVRQERLNGKLENDVWFIVTVNVDCVWNLLNDPTWIALSLLFLEQL